MMESPHLKFHSDWKTSSYLSPDFVRILVSVNDAESRCDLHCRSELHRASSKRSAAKPTDSLSFFSLHRAIHPRRPTKNKHPSDKKVGCRLAAKHTATGEDPDDDDSLTSGREQTRSLHGITKQGVKSRQSFFL
jgi:hypothetical protein